MFKSTYLLAATLCWCYTVSQTNQSVITGADQPNLYLPLLSNKRVAVVANQTSVILQKNQKTYTHLVDSIAALGIQIIKIFAPEHGFRGKADAGELVADGTDPITGLPIISLYGKNKTLPTHHLNNIDIVIFDIQDVGVRFYTYLSTLHYVMEACAKKNIPLVVLDRPNPNGHYIDGPVLELRHKSFVGMHPVPIVYGMTIGEYALMINGEKWLTDNLHCDLTVISLKNYTHNSNYTLPVKPSPNLPNDTAINLYPSLCLFEGTTIGVGRGTNKQFQIIGAPYLDSSQYTYSFIPQPNQGSKYPKYQNQTCNGLDLRKTSRLNNLNLNWLISLYKSAPEKTEFFNPFFTKLAGTHALQEQIEQGMSTQQIKASWKKGLEEFIKIRKRYLLYGHP